MSKSLTTALSAESPIVDRTRLADDVALRRRLLSEAMDRHGLDALLLASEPNAIYTTAYETTFWVNKSKPFVVVLAADGAATIVCHIGESISVELDALDAAVRPYIGPDVVQEPDGFRLDYQLTAADEVATVLRELGAEHVGAELAWHFNPGFTPYAFERVSKAIAPAQLVDASAAIWSTRRIKTGWELERMREAAAVLDKAHLAFAADARAGMTERELSRLLTSCAIEHGAERVPYTGVVAGVHRAPLGGPTDRRLEKGQLLGVDLCCQLGGYWADYCRIYATASPTPPQREAYAKLVDALCAARSVVAAETPVAAVAEALLVTEESPFARAGHGLGLDMPEPPSISALDPTPLHAGEVICLEPNAHVEGVGWLTGEEEVLVTEAGCERISPAFPTELQVIG